MIKTLTPNQQFVIETLRGRGSHFTASVTEKSWREGQPYYLDTRNSARKGIMRAFNQGNREAIK